MATTPHADPCCTGPRPEDASVCTACVGRLTSALRLVGDGLTSELDLTLARQRRTGPGNLGRRSAETPLAYDAAAAEAAAVLRSTLAAWCQALEAESAVPPPSGDDPVTTAAWLDRSVSRLRTSELGPACVDEVTAAVGQAERAVDLPAERVIAGLCSACGAPCYARAGAETARCSDCDTPLSVDEGRRRLLLTAGEQLVTAAEAARALGVLGHRTSAASVRGHARRGRLVRRGAGSAGRPLFRLGEVLDVYLRDGEARSVA